MIRGGRGRVVSSPTNYLAPTKKPNYNRVDQQIIKGVDSLVTYFGISIWLPYDVSYIIMLSLVCIYKSTKYWDKFRSSIEKWLSESNNQ